VKNKVILFLALAAMLAPVRLATAMTTLPPDAAPAAQQILRLPGGAQEGPYLDEDRKGHTWTRI